MVPCNTFWPIVFIYAQILVGSYPLSESFWLLYYQCNGMDVDVSSSFGQLVSRSLTIPFAVFIVIIQTVTTIQFVWCSVKFVQDLRQKKKDASLRVFTTSTLLLNLIYGNICFARFIWTGDIVYVVFGSVFSVFFLLTIVFFYVYKKIIYKNHYFKNLEFVNRAFSMQLNLSHTRNVSRLSQTNMIEELQVPEDI